jgi:hypothetical protein
MSWVDFQIIMSPPEAPIDGKELKGIKGRGAKPFNEGMIKILPFSLLKPNDITTTLRNSITNRIPFLLSI